MTIRQRKKKHSTPISYPYHDKRDSYAKNSNSSKDYFVRRQREKKTLK